MGVFTETLVPERRHGPRHTTYSQSVSLAITADVQEKSNHHFNVLGWDLRQGSAMKDPLSVREA